MCLHLKLPNTRRIFILNANRPPSSNKLASVGKIYELLDYTLQYPGCEVDILGDLNLNYNNTQNGDRRQLNNFRIVYALQHLHV